MVKWGDFQMILTGKRTNKRKLPGKPPRPGIQGFCYGGNHCGNSGNRALVFGKGTRLSVIPSKCFQPSLILIGNGFFP